MTILDLVAEDAKALNAQLGVKDQQKLAQYLDSIRDIEKRIDIAQKTDTRDLKPQIEMEEGLRLAARKSLDRMLEMASGTVGKGDLGKR